MDANGICILSNEKWLTHFPWLRLVMVVVVVVCRYCPCWTRSRVEEGWNWQLDFVRVSFNRQNLMCLSSPWICLESLVITLQRRGKCATGTANHYQETEEISLSLRQLQRKQQHPFRAADGRGEINVLRHIALPLDRIAKAISPMILAGRNLGGNGIAPFPDAREWKATSETIIHGIRISLPMLLTPSVIKVSQLVS